MSLWHWSIACDNLTSNITLSDKAKDRTTGEIVALKKILMQKKENGKQAFANA